jgi:hypothetical protein
LAAYTLDLGQYHSSDAALLLCRPIDAGPETGGDDADTHTHGNIH